MPKSKKATQPKKVTEVDAIAGQRLRIRRTELGISQSAIADHLDITFQQIQKYEKGTNRLSIGRLQQLARFLDVPITYFFEEKRTGANKQNGAKDTITQMLMTRDGNKLCSMWLKMPPARRNKVFKLVEMMAA